MWCCRSDWPGLCLFCYQPSCVNHQLILGFFVSYIFQFYPPLPQYIKILPKENPILPSPPPAPLLTPNHVSLTALQFHGSQDMHMSVRMEAIDHILANKAVYQQFLTVNVERSAVEGCIESVCAGGGGE